MRKKLMKATAAMALCACLAKPAPSEACIVTSSVIAAITLENVCAAVTAACAAKDLHTWFRNHRADSRLKEAAENGYIATKER